MDEFENIAADLLEREGFWVRQSFKFDLLASEKEQFGKNQRYAPRPEIDLIAIDVVKRKVIAFEVKSFLDSEPTTMAAFAPRDTPQGKYRLFTCAPYRDFILGKLKQELVTRKLIPTDWTSPIRLGLIAGNLKKADVPNIKKLFHKNRWELWPPSTIKRKLRALKNEKYENDQTVMTVKLLLR